MGTPQQRQQSGAWISRIAAAIAAALILPAGAAAAANADAAEAATVRIGFAGRLTEPIVKSAMQGAELAIEDANERAAKERRPLRFELVPQDDQGSENFALNVASYFIKTKVAGVVGPWSSDAALVTAPLYEKAGIPMVGFTASSSKLTSQGYQVPFRVVGGTADVAVALADVAANVLQGQHVAVIHNESVYSRAVTQSLIEQLDVKGVHEVLKFSVGKRTADFNDAIKAAMAKTIDVLVFTAQYPQVMPFLSAVKRLNSTAKILLTGGASNASFTGMDNGQLYVLEYDLPYDHCPRWKAFGQSYEKKYGTVPTSYSRYAYNAASVLTDAIQRAGAADGRAVVSLLHQSRHVGLSGGMKFDAQGNVANPTFTLYHFDQRWRPVRYFPADAKPGGPCS